jgi:sugar phosphate isomerase/epimerase
MYLSMNAVPIGGKLNWRQFAELASATGFKGVDVNLDAALSDGVKRTQTMLNDLQLRPAFVSLPVEFRKDDETFRKTMPLLEDAAPFASAIGCPRMMTYIMPSSDTPTDELRRTYKARFTAIANVLARSHVRLGLEFLGPVQFRTRGKYEFIWKMNDMLQFAKECGSNVGLTLDSWHWYHAGGTPDDIVAAGKDRIVVVHFEDAARQAPELVRDNERLLPGEGVIDLTGFLRALRQIDYEDGLSIEVFGHGLKQMPPEQSAKMCLDAGRATLQAAGIKES